MDRLRIGQVARPHGLAGELRVKLDDPSSTALEEVERAFVGGREQRILRARPVSGGFVLLSLEGVSDRDAAGRLSRLVVEVRRADLRLEQGEFFVADLIGCEIVDESGQSLGRGVGLVRGAQDLLVIQDAGRGVEFILPIVPDFVLSVDRSARRVVVALPEGLPEEPLPPASAPGEPV